MNGQREVVVLSGVRTAIGDYGGSLKDQPPTELGARVVGGGGVAQQLVGEDAAGLAQAAADRADGAPQLRRRLIMRFDEGYVAVGTGS